MCDVISFSALDADVVGAAAAAAADDDGDDDDDNYRRRRRQRLSRLIGKEVKGKEDEEKLYEKISQRTFETQLAFDFF